MSFPGECELIPPPASSLTFSLFSADNPKDEMEILVEFNGKPIYICQSPTCKMKKFYETIMERMIDEESFKNKCLLFPELKKRTRLKERATWYYKLVTIISLCLATLFLFCIFFECVFRKRDAELLLKASESPVASQRSPT